MATQSKDKHRYNEQMYAVEDTIEGGSGGVEGGGGGGGGGRGGGTQYFPSYEIMMDELRDYRYYKEDFVHPSGLAETIIFSRFMDTFILDADTKLLCDKVRRVLTGVNHRPHLETAQAYKAHLLTLLKQMNEISLLAEKSPSAMNTKIDFTSEKEHISSSLLQHFDHVI
jgi:hypothetical protein